MQPTPSPQQRAVYDWVLRGSGNLVVESVAGSGKTTLLVGVCKLLRGSAVYTAFNRDISDEVGAKLEAEGVSKRTVKSATFHSLGWGAWRRVAEKCVLDKDKIHR